VLVSDLEALPDDLLGILVAVADEHQRPIGVGEPAQPGAERRAQRDRQRARQVTAAKSSGGRTSMTSARRCGAPRTAAAVSGSSVGGRPWMAGPRRFTSAAAGSRTGSCPARRATSVRTRPRR
jgi:hypothetical protein